MNDRGRGAGDAPEQKNGRQAPAPSSEPRRDGRESGGRFVCDVAGNPLGFDRAIEALTGWEVGVPAARGATDGPPLVFGMPPQIEGPAEIPLRLRCHDGSHLEVRCRVAPVGRSRTLAAVEVRHVLARIPVAPDPKDADFDPLTRLPMGERFAQRMEETLGYARRLGQPMGLLVVDVDGMTALNASWGRERGDGLLARVAGILQASVRQADIVGRHQADSFLVVLAGIGRGQARHVGGRLRQSVERFAAAALGGDAPPVTVSIGVACHPADGVAGDELIKRGELALNEARRLGKNRVWCYQRRPRVPARASVFVAGNETTPIGQVRDISNSGVFVETEEDLPIDLRVGLAFTLPGDDEPVRIVGRVARRVPPGGPGRIPGAIPGLGVEFEVYSDKARARLEAFLRRTMISG